MSALTYSVGVDIGGTKIAAAIINEKGEVQTRHEISSMPNDREKMFEQVAACIEQVIRNAGLDYADIHGLGVGLPGKVDRQQGVAVFQNNIAWTDFPIVERLKSRFPIDRIVIDNDVYMAAYGEWNCSTPKAAETFVYATVSTGISCATIHQGAFVRGGGFAGEIGLLPARTPSSWKQERATLEQVAAGPAIERYAQEILQNPELDSKEFFRQYADGNFEASVLLEEIADSLARAFYSIVCLLDPQKIVVGGGVINHQPQLLELIKDALAKYVTPEQAHIVAAIHTSTLKGNSGVVGAALKAMELPKLQEIKQ